MKRHRPLNVLFICLICLSAAATPSRADTRWSRTAPEGAGFSIEVPGELKITDEGDQYLYRSKGWVFTVWSDPNEAPVRALVERGDRKGLERELELSRDSVFRVWEATRRGSSSTAEIDGYASLRFSFEDTDHEYIGLLVLTAQHEYTVLAARPKGASDDDAKRFVRSFRLTTPAAGRR
jgi:hypothetical protein